MCCPKVDVHRMQSHHMNANLAWLAAHSEVRPQAADEAQQALTLDESDCNPAPSRQVAGRCRARSPRPCPAVAPPEVLNTTSKMQANTARAACPLGGGADVKQGSTPADASNEEPCQRDCDEGAAQDDDEGHEEGNGTWPARVATPTRAEPTMPVEQAAVLDDVEDAHPPRCHRPARP